MNNEDDIISDDLKENPSEDKNSENSRFSNGLICSGVSEIVLDKDIHLDNSIRIDDDELVIDGQGHVIDANAKTRIFDINGKNITIKNLTFKNGYDNGGIAGAIYNNGSLTCENCTFEGNSSIDNYMGDAGAINNSGSLILVNCIFKDNHTRKKGGAILNNASLTCENCTFEGNYSNESGGDIYNQGSLILDGCSFNPRFKENIYNKKILDIKNSDFKNSHIVNLGLINIHKSNFITDSDSYYSDYYTISQNYEESKLVIEYSTFTSDKIINVLTGSATISHSNFNCSSENIDNHIISNNGTLNLIESEFPNKKLLFNNNIINLDDEKLLKLIEQGPKSHPINLISDGISRDYKGFSYLDKRIQEGLDEIIIDCNILIHNTEQKFYEGGIVLDKENLIIDGQNHTIDAKGLSRFFIVLTGNITLKNIIFKNGKYFKNQYWDDVGGGAIYTFPNTSLTLENCKFIDNTSNQKAGSIFNNSNLRIKKVKFKNNSSEYQGGAIYNNNGSVSLEACCFENNSSEYYGGAIYNIDATLNLEKCNFHNNSSKYQGGAIYNNSGSLIFKTSTFNRNSSLMEVISSWNNYSPKIFDQGTPSGIAKLVMGGAIYNKNGFLNFKRCDFEDNSANGEIYTPNNVYGDSDTITVTGSGGAIYSGGSLSLENCNFNINSSNNGGAIYAKDNLKLKKCKFNNNSVKGKEGGRYYPSLNGCGGAIYTEGTLNCNDCNFQNNLSVTSFNFLVKGAAIYSKDTLNCINCIFENNLTISNDNSYSIEGGAIYAESILKLEECKFNKSDKIINR